MIQCHARAAATWLGVAIMIVVVIVYLPMLLTVAPSGWLAPIDAIFDTMLFAGASFLIASAMPREARA